MRGVDVDLVSLVGMVRSGTTFLEGAVAHRSGGVAVGELVGAWGALQREDKICSCGTSARTCPFWIHVGRFYPALVDPETQAFMIDAHRNWTPVRHAWRWIPAIASHRFPWVLSERATEYQTQARSLILAVGRAAEEMGYGLVVDSSKHPLFYSITKAERESFRSHRPLHLVRDPRGVILSLNRPKHDITLNGPRAMKGYTRLRALVYWLLMNLPAEILVRLDQGTTLRYEDLGVEDTMRQLHLPISTGTGAQHQLVANPVRRSVGAPFSLDDRWREDAALSSTWLRIVLFPLLRHYRYT